MRRGLPVASVGALALLMLATLIGSAHAQKVERPEVRVNDQWRFAVYHTVPTTTPNRVWVITSVTAATIEGTQNGEALTLSRELNILESPDYAYSNRLELTFPLEVGKRWRYTTDWLLKAKGSRGTATVDVTVVGYDRVKVPAGEFDALKLLSRANLVGVSPINSQYAGEVTTTYWYAPAARAIVKSVSHNPYLGPTSVELVAFELQP
jgi:hypothetical protein